MQLRTLSIFAAILTGGCAYIGTVAPPPDHAYAQVDVVSVDSAPRVQIFSVLGHIPTPPLEFTASNSPRRLYLSPGHYKLEALCATGYIYVHYFPKFEIDVVSGERYTLDCHPANGNENFALSRGL